MWEESGGHGESPTVNHVIALLHITSLTIKFSLQINLYESIYKSKLFFFSLMYNIMHAFFLCMQCLVFAVYIV